MLGITLGKARGSDRALTRPFPNNNKHSYEAYREVDKLGVWMERFWGRGVPQESMAVNYVLSCYLNIMSVDCCCLFILTSVYGHGRRLAVEI